MTNVKSLMSGFLTIDDALSLNGETTKALQLTHLNRLRTLDGHAKYFTRAEGCTFIDENGDRHLDMIGAGGVGNRADNKSGW